VRPQFRAPLTATEARQALGIPPQSPLLLVTGGSQGAATVNELVLKTVPQLREAIPGLQVMHLTGPSDYERTRNAYAAQNISATVHPFFSEMGLALAAADVAVSRAGASSLAELAARQLPAVLIPYPTAADNHQYFNARAFEQTGAARMLAQQSATPAQLAGEILDLLRDTTKRAAMRQALAAWHRPEAAAEIAERILHWTDDSGKVVDAPGVKLKALSC
jgi:UDP-N-acetylglucosamine--N-acetylmuramyl-(pentapeptide) pyrophosphoryl-undecaprenol N-acetylglucosamine transferase